MSLDQVYFGLPFVGHVIGHGFLPTLIICLIICPGIPYLLGAVVDGYWVPWHYSVQFFAFLPGNLFLALYIACTSVTFQSYGFQINPWVNAVVFVGAFTIYLLLQKLDVQAHYTPGQLRSAMKRYHNSLYFWYGYLAIVCGIAMWGSPASLAEKLLFTLPGIVWLLCMVGDTLMGKNELITAQRFMFAHVESMPIWRNNWHIRRLTKTADGYAYV